EAVVDDDAARDPRRAIALIDGQVRLLVAGRPRLVAEHGMRPVDLAPGRLGVRIDEQLARVAAVPALRRVGAVDAQAVEVAGAQPRHVPVEDVAGPLLEIEPFGLAGRVVRIVEADLDAGRDLRPDREVDAATVEGRPTRVRVPWPYRPHRNHLGNGRAGAQ